MSAADKNHPDVATLLLARRANAAAANSEGKTAMTYAQAKNNPQLVAALQARGARPEAVQARGTSGRATPSSANR
jgi:ankyrin repeat protein